MTDVTIAAEIAQEMAEYHREFAPGEAAVRSASWHQTMADLLDPKPPTLREKVADVLAREVTGGTAWLPDADAVLAVFRAALTDLKRPATVTTLDAAIEYVDEALFGGGSS